MLEFDCQKLGTGVVIGAKCLNQKQGAQAKSTGKVKHHDGTDDTADHATPIVCVIRRRKIRKARRY